jgi:ABC-type sulfate transport system substrate-binding protein
MYPWDAVIVRLSDEKHLTTVFGRTTDEALAEARSWVVDEEAVETMASEYPTVRSLHVDDQGRDAEAPQSVKV